ILLLEQRLPDAGLTLPIQSARRIRSRIGAFLLALLKGLFDLDPFFQIGLEFFMLRKSFYKTGDFIFCKVLLDESEEMFFNLISVLVLYFEDGHGLDMILFKIIDDRLFAVK